MEESNPVRLVEIAGLYLFYFENDHAFTHMMQDPRARIISPDEVIIAWQTGDIDWKTIRDTKGLSPFVLASLHYWRNSIDFDYVDIGAHGGLTTISQAVFYRRCGKSNRVYAFEPGDVFPLLEEAVKLNRLDDMTKCVRKAVTDEIGRVEFFVTPAQSPASSLMQAAVSRPEIVESKSIVVDATTFDEFAQLRPVAGLLIKVDAEGVDFKVVAGMRRTLANKLCTLQIELHPAMIDHYADPVHELTELASDFEMIDLGVTPHQRIDPDTANIAAFVARIREQQAPLTDVFLIPKRLPLADDLVAEIITN